MARPQRRRDGHGRHPPRDRSPECIVNTQLFDQDWTGGEVRRTLLLIERNGQTTLTNTLVYSSKETRDAVLKTPMDKGMSIGYDELETLLASL